MSSPSYLDRLREKKIKNMRYTGTAQTAKTNLHSLRSLPLGHKKLFFSDDAKSTLPEPKADESITSWGWRIINPDGSTVEAYYSPRASLEYVLKDHPGAVKAVPIPEQNLTTTRVEIAADLKRMIQAMGQYWNYSIEDFEAAHDGARTDPHAWWVLCLEDQRRFGWTVPTPEDIAQAVKEAAEKRRAILEHAAKLAAEQADRITQLARAFYNHCFGPAVQTRCCIPRCNRYCAEGVRLRDAYYGATS